MRLAIINHVWSPQAQTPDATLDRFATLTGWAEAVKSAGIETVGVFQRFHQTAQRLDGIVPYHFYADDGPPRPPTWFRGAITLHRAVVTFRPDVVHVNSLEYPLLTRRLARLLPASTALVVQDHGGFDPARLSRMRKGWMRFGVAGVDALLVATAAQVDHFRRSGLVPSSVAVWDVMEGSTTVGPIVRRHREAPPSLLWVGRLNANKDPLTVLAGFDAFLDRSPGATLTMIYAENDLEPQVRAYIGERERLRSAVRLVGSVRHADLEAVYADADFFVLGSRYEGSGYAVLEALACGVVPVLTDIPSFRTLTAGGSVGDLWRVGDPSSLRDALVRVASRPLPPQRDACRRLFDRELSWTAIGVRAVDIYKRAAASVKGASAG